MDEILANKIHKFLTNEAHRRADLVKQDTTPGLEHLKSYLLGTADGLYLAAHILAFVVWEVDEEDSK